MPAHADTQVVVFWFRRDLRLHDNAALYHAQQHGLPVLPLFIYDTDILNALEDKDDARVSFIYDSIEELHNQLKKHDSSLLALQGRPLDLWRQLLKDFTIKAVYTNTDYEPYARKRDEAVESLLKQHDIPLHSYKDQVIFEKGEVLKDDGKPYYVYTPYSRRWRTRLNDYYLKPYPNSRYMRQLWAWRAPARPTLGELGFTRSAIQAPPARLLKDTIKTYDKTRNFPALPHGTSQLGVQLRFGTISPRRLAAEAQELNHTYLNELIWREFFMCILYHHPEVAGQPFHKEYENIQWRNNDAEFEAWCQGRTGYPLVDAGMRQLNTTGYMHNRVRMLVANFLTRLLLIDWRWGESYFARKLLDYDLASNNGNWQWCAGTGVDSAPYFRIFNPMLQQEKFDEQGKYIRRYVPEYGTPAYPKPIVDYKPARQRALEAYKAVKG